MGDPDIKAARHELSVLIRRGRNFRVTEWTRERPTDWRPTQVIDPRSEEPFTEEGAWEFVAETLECRDVEVVAVELRKPPGKTAFAFCVRLEHSTKELYVKLQLGSGKVIGRSFHYSKREER